jgi:SPP1 gp7 family putative phage head morphogenesis protein
MTPKQYDRQHLKHLSAMDRRIDQLFDKTLKRLASYGIFLDKPLGDQPFSFADYPDVQQVIDGIFEEFRQSVEVVITKGLAWEDNLSASKATDIASRYGVAVAQQRSQAVAGFAQRKVGGLDLSQRVWNITDTFEKEVETAMDIALRDGTPANRLATDLKQYLKHPDKLFRRVRDEHGQLQLSKRAKEFHPGAGVYRSSYKNARRLAVTETNMAYHKADNERWRQLDFVLGYEVQVSGTNPNVCPICVELAGKYPKEFEFVGWHPHCRCHAVPIMEDIDSFQARQEALLRGERIPATGQVTEPPKNFTDHLANNSDRIARSSKAGTLPYFVRDNYEVGKDGTLTPTFTSKAPTPYKGAFKGLPKEKSATPQQAPSNFKDVRDKLQEATKPFEHNLYGTFEPFSPMIIEVVRMAKDRKAKNAIFESILNDERASVLYQTQTAKTTIFPNHKGKRSPVWAETKQMARDLNQSGISVSFLPEMDETSCSDALLKIGKKNWHLADFKYSATTNSNTLAKQLMGGFEQANYVVLKMEKGDLGTIRDAVEECKRKGTIGSIILINKNGNVYELTRRSLMSGRYRKILKGEL